MKKRLFSLCMASVLMLGLASNASAADYTISTDPSPQYYGSTFYEDLYEAEYNYGGRNQIDYDIPEVQLRTESAVSGNLSEQSLPGQ